MGVEPAEGASIDQNGTLSIDETTEHNTRYLVTADVENGRRLVTAEVFIYVPEANPLVGYWREEAQFACGSGEAISPETHIEEFRFKADGSFSVTWFPFELYKDYWGDYEFDLTTGELTMVVDSGNYIPEDLDL